MFETQADELYEIANAAADKLVKLAEENRKLTNVIIQLRRKLLDVNVIYGYEVVHMMDKLLEDV